MRRNKSLLLSRLLPPLAALALLATHAPVALAQSTTTAYGILILFPGGGPRANKELLSVQSLLNAKIPTETAFGIADLKELQGAVSRLESRQVKKIVAVPLFLVSRSPEMDHTRYVLGILEKLPEKKQAAGGGKEFERSMEFPSKFGGGADRIQTRLPVVLTPALDAHPLTADILLARARALSKDPSRETVILVAAGPVSEDENAALLETMQQLAEAVREKGKLKAAGTATFRNDSPQEAKQKAVSSLQDLIRHASRDGGRALLVPYFLVPGGFESRLQSNLEGLFYSWDGKTLMPHPNIGRWIRGAASEGAKQEDMRQVK